MQVVTGTKEVNRQIEHDCYQICYYPKRKKPYRSLIYKAFHVLAERTGLRPARSQSVDSIDNFQFCSVAAWYRNLCSRSNLSQLLSRLWHCKRYIFTPSDIDHFVMPDFNDRCSFESPTNQHSFGNPSWPTCICGGAKQFWKQLAMRQHPTAQWIFPQRLHGKISPCN